MQVVKTNISAVLFCTACVSKGLLDKSSIGGNYILEREKLKDNKTIIAGQFFHLESKSEFIPAFMNINGVIHQTDSGRFNFQVLPGSYKIQGGFIGKKSVVTKEIKLERGDSLFLKLYLIDDNLPLYEK
jgi:hypothetical protein